MTEFWLDHDLGYFWEGWDLYYWALAGLFPRVGTIVKWQKPDRVNLSTVTNGQHCDQIKKTALRSAQMQCVRVKREGCIKNRTCHKNMTYCKIS